MGMGPGPSLTDHRPHLTRLLLIHRSSNECGRIERKEPEGRSGPALPSQGCTRSSNGAQTLVQSRGYRCFRRDSGASPNHSRRIGRHNRGIAADIRRRLQVRLLRSALTHPSGQAKSGPSHELTVSICTHQASSPQGSGDCPTAQTQLCC